MMALTHLRTAWSGIRSPGTAAGVAEPLGIRLTLALILCGALLVRCLMAFRGLPYLHFWDEPLVVSAALNMLKHGTLRPEHFSYGTLPTYLCMAVSALCYYWLMGRPETDPPFLTHIDKIVTYYDTGWFWQISHPSFYLWCRWGMAILGVATVLLVYLIARRIAGRWAGLLAAGLLAFQQFHVEQSTMATVDNPMTFFVILAAWGAVAFLDTPRGYLLVTSLVACGLAAACKYPAALSVVMPALALAMGDPAALASRRGRLWSAVAVIPPLAFLAGMPYALLDLRRFLVDVGTQVGVYQVAPHAASQVEPGLPHLELQAGRMVASLGAAAAVIALAGVALMLSRRAGWILLVYGAVHAVFFSRARLDFHRNFLVLYPLAAIAFGAGAVLLMRWLRLMAEEWRGAARAAPAAAVALVVALVAWPAAGAATKGLAAFEGRESRTGIAMAAAGIASHDASVRVAVPAELRLHPYDLERIGPAAVVAPYLDLICRQAEFTHLLAPEIWRSYLPRDRPRARLYGDLVPPATATIDAGSGKNPLFLDAPSKSPRVDLVSLSGGDTEGTPGGPCPVVAGARDLETGEPREISPAGELVLHGKGQSLTPWGVRTTGAYALVADARGTLVAGQFPGIRLTVLGRDAAGGEEVLASAEAGLDGERNLYPLGFELHTVRPIRARVEVVNALPNAGRRARRDVFLSEVVLVRLKDGADPAELKP